MIAQLHGGPLDGLRIDLSQMADHPIKLEFPVDRQFKNHFSPQPKEPPLTAHRYAVYVRGELREGTSDPDRLYIYQETRE